jgi:hypothetical protein
MTEELTEYDQMTPEERKIWWINWIVLFELFFLTVLILRHFGFFDHCRQLGYIAGCEWVM